MEQWNPLSADKAIQQAQAMSEIDIHGDNTADQQYRIFFRRFDTPATLSRYGQQPGGGR